MGRFSEVILLAFLGWGLVFCFAMPPFHVPDESAHWLSAVVMADGGGSTVEACNTAVELPNYFATGDVINRPDVPFPWEKFKKLGEVKKTCSKVPVVYSNFFTYPVAVTLSFLFPKARESGFAAAHLLYLSRLLSGLLIAWMLWRVLKGAVGRFGTLPTGAMTLVAFCLSPLFLQQSFAVTSDTVVLAGSLALVAVMVAWPHVDALSLALLFVLGGGAALSKPVLAPLFFSLAVAFGFRAWGFPRHWWQGSQDRKSRWPVGVCLGLGSLALLGLVFFQLRGGIAAGTSAAAAHPMAKFQYLLGHPAEFLRIVIQTHLPYFRPQAWTGYLGYLDTEPLPRLTALWGGLLAVALCFDFASWLRWFKESPKGNSGQGWALGSVAAGAVSSWLAIDLALYLSETPLGEPTIWGLQRRYFFPILLVSLGALAPMTPVGGLLGHPAISVMRRRRGVEFMLRALGILFYLEFMLALFFTLAKRYG